MSKERSLILIFCCFAWYTYLAQKNSTRISGKNIASLKADSAAADSLISACRINLTIHSEKSLQQGSLALQKSLAAGWKEGIARSMCCIGENYLRLGDNNTALGILESGLKFATDDQTISALYLNLGTAHRSAGNYPTALEYGFKSLSLNEAAADSAGIADSWNFLGGVYYYTDDPGEHEKALAYFERSLDLSRHLNLKPGMIHALQNMGIIYTDSGDDSLALQCYANVSELCRQENDQAGIALNNYIIGKLYFKRGDMKKALPYILKAKEGAARIPHKRYYTAAIHSEASIYVKMAKKATGQEKTALLDKAEKLLHEAIALSKSANNLLNLITHYDYLSDLYSERGDHKRSKEAYITFSDLRDSLYSFNSRETIKHIEDKRTIELRDREIEVNKLSLEAKERQKWFLLSATGLLIVIGLLLFYQSRSRKKNNEQLHALNAELEEANRVKARFFSIINHDLRSPVSNLIHFLHLKNESPELLTEQHKQEMEHKVVSAAENLLISMEDLLLWSKGQMQNFQPAFREIAIDQLFEDLHRHFQSGEQVLLLFEDPQKLRVNSDPDYLKTIMRNLTGNAVKALEKTPGPRIVWKAYTEKGHICLSITDNGPGGSVEQFRALYDEHEVTGIRSGLGLHLIRDLAKAIDCTVSVESKINEGTSVTLRFD